MPGSTSAAGDAGAPGNLASLPTGALVARIGGGPWFFAGPSITSASSTKTVTATGQVYLAPEDASAYGDNSGFIRAALDVLPSTSPKIWTGGTLGFEKQADIDQNWIGGYPRPGERAVFDSSAYDCDWNIPFAALSQLDVSTAYVKTITLLPPQFHQNNSLVVTGDATIGGGRLELNKSSSTFQVQGRLIVQTSATLSMGGFISIGAGAEFRSGSFWRNDDYANVSRAFPGNSYYLRVVGATVAVAGPTQVDGMLSIDFTSTTFTQLDRIQFNNYPTASTIPLVSFANGNPVSYVFRDWS